MEWQDISTAPKDGTEVLLSDHNGHMETGYWYPKGTSITTTGNIETTGVWFAGGGWYQPEEVTHWMPLPEPPT